MLENKLDNLVRWNRSYIDDINKGGCGRFALYLHRHLRQLGVHTKILCVDSWEKIPPKRQKLMNFQGDSFSHVMLVLYQPNGKSLYIDGHNIYNKFPSRWSLDDYNFGYLTYEQLSIAVGLGRWNSTYSKADDRKVINAIKRFVN